MQLQIWTDISWSLIVSLIVGSATLAYLGDVLGFKYGKQRISLFGLRPKYTSRLVTALTGVFISLTVLTVMSFFSQNVRTALFSMKYLQQQLRELHLEQQNSRMELEEALLELSSNRERLREQETLLQTTALSLDMTAFDLETLRNDRALLLNEKNDLESAVTSLREESEELKRNLTVMRLETIAIQANSLLAQQVVLPDTSQPRVREILASLEREVRTSAAERISEKRVTLADDIKLVFDPIEESDIIERAANSSDRLYIRALAAENVAVGEELKVRLETDRSFLLYNEGETLYRKLVNPEEKDFNAEETLHVFLRELKKQAIKNGVMPDPATNSVGSLEGEDFFEVVEKLKTLSAPTIINAVALQDIYTEGPVRIRIEFQE